MLGAVVNGQVADSVSVTTVDAQASVPAAVTVLLTVQVSIGAVKDVVKSAVSPGARVIGPVTGVPGAGWSFTTVTLFKITLPVFFTVPE
jgi:hypothetical protein